MRRIAAPGLGLLVLLAGGRAHAVVPPPFGGRAAPPPAAPGLSDLLAEIWAAFLALQRQAIEQIIGQMEALERGLVEPAVLLGLLFAFLYGSLHTLGPGHGKFVVASYFLAREARIGRGLLMGAQIAATHVVAAVLIVVLADLTARQLLGGSAPVLRMVSLGSYGAIALLGLVMLTGALRRAFGAGGHHPGPAHDHGVDHHHHHHHHHHGQQGVVSMLVGVLPCTGAMLVMLFALANGVVLAGVLMVAAMGLGMAMTMAVLGILAIMLRTLVVALFGTYGRAARRAALAMEVIGAVAVTTIGALLFAAAY